MRRRVRRNAAFGGACVKADPLAALDAAIEAAAPGERAALVVSIAARLAALGAGLAEAAPSPATAEADRNLSIAEAAKRLGVSARYLYRHADELHAVRIGRRLLFSARGLDRIVVARTAR
jgi:excisionase family DNA binding protein